MRLLQKLRELFLPKRKSAAAFVDYEYWFYSMRNLFHIDPDPKKWIEEVRTQYSVEDIYLRRFWLKWNGRKQKNSAGIGLYRRRYRG